jgi:hypothetical protein
MTHRIRYRKNHNPRWLVSVQVFAGPMGEGFQVHLNLDARTYEIVDLNSSSQVVADGEAVSLAQLKIKAKKELSRFGITFENEKRNKVTNSVEV